MPKTTITSVTLIGALALTMLAVAPDKATAVSDPNGVMITVVGGALTISSVTEGAATNSATPSSAGVSISGMTSHVEVTDARGIGNGNWTAKVKSTPFTTSEIANKAQAEASMAGAVIRYTPGVITTSGISTVTSGGALNLTTTTQPAVTATGTSGLNTATWTATLGVTIPATALIGVYTATIEHSVL